MFVPDEKFGDYATNVALIIGKKRKRTRKTLQNLLSIRLVKWIPDQSPE